MAAQFVWPPMERADEPIIADLPDTELPESSFPRSGLPEVAPPPTHRSTAIERIEADLLGVQSVSFGRWAKRSGWKPDLPDRFCWRCAGSVGSHETDGDGCATCRGHSLRWDRASRLGMYKGGLRSGVLELKFGRWRRSGSEMGRVLGDRLSEMAQAGGVDAGSIALVPVPSSWRRRIGRGIDHTLVLARAAGSQSGVRVVRGLGRVHGQPQVGLSAADRTKNIQGKVLARRGLGRIGSGLRAVVLLDDVRTTGATLSECARVVRQGLPSGIRPEIWVLTAAVVSERPGDRAGALVGSESAESA